VSWAIGYDENWKRDIGYGVPAVCDHPECSAEIDRGLAYACGSEPLGGEHGCGLYFCSKHRLPKEFDDDCCVDVCERCEVDADPFDAKPDVQQWRRHKLNTESWQQWRDENPEEVAKLRSLER
jgi:hypothetical protein